ncbi:MAG: response regulator [Pseudomonadota bacterium]
MSESALCDEFLSEMTLLCVEDDKYSQMLYPLLFDDIVSRVILVDNEVEAYRRFKEDHVDIIITDYHLPQLNGLALIQKIRADNSTIPIIFVTAIDETNVIIEALKLHVSNFVRKPINTAELLDVVTVAAKMVIAERYMEDERSKKLEQLHEKEQYSAYQQKLAFDKELNILRNDFYYQMLESPLYHKDGSFTIPDFIYRPLDILSGDAYSARRIDEYQTLYLLVDGMGKGMSASLSAMLMTSHINHMIDGMLKQEKFDFHELIINAMDYIRPILLDDEMLSIDFYLINQEHNTMYYAKFAMPPSLLQDNTNRVIKIKSNNPPMNKYQNQFNIAQIDITSIIKFLFCTDGLVENTLKGGTGIYEEMVEEDFVNAFTKEELKKLFFEKIETQEDDVTLIFITDFTLGDSIVHHRIFASSLSALGEAGDWYESLWHVLISDRHPIIENAQVVFTELMMNAYEHGNLGIRAETKHHLMAEDQYLDTLMASEAGCSKMIDVKIRIFNHNTSRYVVTQITDEGAGFDTKELSQIFRNTTRFNGRGVYLSRQSSLGIYYNKLGNSVIFLHKIS